MPCYRPVKGYRSSVVNPTSGKRGIVFNPKHALLSESGRPSERLDLPCGQCIGCRLERSRQWAMRCSHEASLYDSNCFITLTYSPEHLPRFGSLDYSAPVLWMKRLRKKIGDYCDERGLAVPRVRSFGCAEYGEKLGRPHYHIIVFNWDFPDKILFKSSGGNSIFTSDFLADTWQFGHSVTAGFSFESAAYVARYCTKKLTGKASDAYFLDEPPDAITGEVPSRLPERSVCVSRRPGIGRDWYEAFGSHSRAHDFVVLRGKQMKVPRYYDRLFELTDSAGCTITKRNRKRKALALSELEPVPSLTERDRLSVKERCQELKFKELKRSYESG